MPRGMFDRDLRKLQEDLLVLAGRAEEALVHSLDVLKRQDLVAARALYEADEEINRLRFALESSTVTLIATQQPMASDLRVLIAILELASELERIADYAKGIAKIALLIGHEPLIKPLVDLPRMAEHVASMLRRSLQAFVDRDMEAARQIAAEDVAIDDLYNQVYRELLTFIMADPKTLNQATYLLWVGHNLERAADRVTNICERVVFLVSGVMVELGGKEDVGLEGLA